MFSLALALAVGLTIEFVHLVLLDVYVNGRRANLATLPLYWLLWNVFPIAIFGISKLLEKQGR